MNIKLNFKNHNRISSKLYNILIIIMKIINNKQ